MFKPNSSVLHFITKKGSFQPLLYYFYNKKRNLNESNPCGPCRSDSPPRRRVRHLNVPFTEFSDFTRGVEGAAPCENCAEICACVYFTV